VEVSVRLEADLVAREQLDWRIWDLLSKQFREVFAKDMPLAMIEIEYEGRQSQESNQFSKKSFAVES
jgi:hypothetical protein